MKVVLEVDMVKALKTRRRRDLRDLETPRRGCPQSPAEPTGSAPSLSAYNVLQLLC